MESIAKAYLPLKLKSMESMGYYYLSPFIGLFRRIQTHRGASCWCGDCMEQTLTINPDGNVYNCPDLAAEGKSKSFGNLLYDSIDEVLFSPNRLELIVKQKNFTCDCKHLPYCHGSCPLHFLGNDGVSCRKFFDTALSLVKKYKIKTDDNRLLTKVLDEN
ncbi:MAG: hypothetical protein DDT23_01251 [candidate division WS2 bacterium]|nr:hypothetical protein [Candidatus Lithacetigena glycinireducens]